MKPIALSILIVLSMVFVSCGGSKAVTGSYEVTISFEDLTEGTPVYLMAHSIATQGEQRQKPPEPLDTAISGPGGNVVFKGTVAEEILAIAGATPEQSVLFVLHPGTYSMQLKAGERPTFVGSPTSEAMYAMQAKAIPLYQAAAQAEQQVYFAPDPQSARPLREAAIAKKQAFHNMVIGVMDSATSPAVRLYASQMIDPALEYEAFTRLRDHFVKQYPKSRYLPVLSSRINKFAKLNGQTAPEINLPSPNGDSIALSSLQGQVVLLDFWASWCGPCRKENPHIVALYEDLKDHGFTVYSMSLDQKEKNWKAAIAKDQLSWSSHVSELKGWQSESIRPYGVNSIPAAFVVDKDGTIAASHLRGIALEMKIRQLLDL